jgi:precorrin-6A synthase
LYVIGIGTGNPEHVTVQAIKAMNKTNVFFVVNKGPAKSELTQFRMNICQRYIDEATYRTVEIVDPERDLSITSYSERVEAWHLQRALRYEELIEKEIKNDECGAFLVWGDPSLYDSTLRVIDQIIARGRVNFTYEVIPGITSIQALAASHKITLNGIGESICITTGRRLSDHSVSNVENVIVMLDGKCSFKEISDKEVDIYWGAYVGSDQEILISGSLLENQEDIETAHNAARNKYGWIMDIYLLRTRSDRGA